MPFDIILSLSRCTDTFPLSHSPQEDQCNILYTFRLTQVSQLPAGYPAVVARFQVGLVTST